MKSSPESNESDQPNNWDEADGWEEPNDSEERHGRGRRHFVGIAVGFILTLTCVARVWKQWPKGRAANRRRWRKPIDAHEPSARRNVDSTAIPVATPIRGFGQPSGRPPDFSGPFGIAFGPDGALYVADDLAHRIVVLDQQGRFLRELGGPGDGKRTLSFVDALDFDADGNILATDTGGNRIVTLDSHGRILREFGRSVLWSGLRNPRDVRFGRDGLVYVADFGRKRISVFASSGAFLHGLGDKGPESLQGPVQTGVCGQW